MKVKQEVEKSEGEKYVKLTSQDPSIKPRVDEAVETAACIARQQRPLTPNVPQSSSLIKQDLDQLGTRLIQSVHDTQPDMACNTLLSKKQPKWSRRF